MFVWFCSLVTLIDDMLSFITPAVVSPEIVDIDLPVDDLATMRRGLMVVAKILQNLANNIFFGKEAYMIVLNKFLEGQIANVTRFLSEIHVRHFSRSIATLLLITT